MTGRRQRILVIKLGALGDFVQALGPMAAIRRHHAAAHIVLLTTAGFAGLARASGYADEVWLDDRPTLLAFAHWFSLRRRLRAARFDRVYDLQTAERTNWYYRLLGPGPRPEWSGIAPGCSHPHANPARNAMHTLDRQAEQLRMAGIADVPPPDLSWARAEISGLRPPAPYALLVPGGAAHRPEKRWPVERYAALAQVLATRGVTSAVLGTGAERPLARTIRAACATAWDLTARTSLEQIATLARGAAMAIGNDTGPMHLIAAAGCPALVLFSAASDPALCAPRGGNITILRRDRLAALTLEAVLAALPTHATPA
ncbi:MAG TPA: glycosyltransferase family 9 protein [Alphaproteobacteria bacterium]|nr:glycosyltransferase family 9 protein [Alphaproteobacteria bacterium]